MASSIISTLVDRVGQEFGNFTLLGVEGKKVSLRCGFCLEEKVYDKPILYKINDGIFNHCGCKKEKIKDSSGKEIKGYFVESYDKTSATYHIKCLSCEEERDVRKTSIDSEKIGKCKCLQKIEVGQVLGKFKLIKISEKEIPNRLDLVTVECPVCKKHFQTKLMNVRQSLIKSCGCLTKENKKPFPYTTAMNRRSFGDLTILESLFIKSKRRQPDGTLHYFRRYKVKCSCGNVKEFSSGYLFGKNPPTHCGCKKEESKRKELIEKYLGLVAQL